MLQEKSKRNVYYSEEARKRFYLLFDNLSNRTQHLLLSNNIDSIEGLTPWIEGKCDDFLKFRYCGKLTSKELMAMVLELRNHVEFKNEPLDENDLGVEGTLLSDGSEPPLTVSFNEASKREFKILFDKLSVRAQHVLMENGLNSLESLAPWIERRRNNFLDFRNCGQGTSTELMGMVLKLREPVGLLYPTEEDNSNNPETEIMQLVRQCDAFRSSFLDPEIKRLDIKYKQLGYFPFFLALYLRIQSNKTRNFNVFRQSSDIFVGEEMKTLSTVASDTGITRERARQIRKSQFRKLHTEITKASKCGFLENHKYDAEKEYELKNIASREEVAFNSNFIVWVVCQIDNRYKLLGNVSNAFFSSSKSAETLYAIPKVLYDCFDFESFIKSIENQLHKKRYYEERIELEQFVRRLFEESTDTDIFYELVKVCRNILERGYPEIIVNSQIVFSVNARKPLPDIIEDILRNNGIPMTADELSVVFTRDYPEIEQSPKKISSNALRNPNVIAISRTSTYTLREWSDIHDKRGGTIRELASEYLNSLPQPIATLTEICNYIAKFRDGVKESSVKANLLAEANNLFGLYFKDGQQFIGLTDGHIDDVYEKLDKQQERRTFSESIERLESFIKNNGRFPFSSGVDKEESRLFRFYNLSLGNLRKGVLSAEDAVEIERITSTYGHLKIKKERVSWDEWLERFVKYITENNALPIHSSREYTWYEENKALFEAGLLMPDQTSAFAFLNKIVSRISCK